MSEQQVLQRETARPSRIARIARFLPNLLALVLAAALCIGIATNWDRWVGGAANQWTDDAYLQSDLTPLSALVAAPVLKVLVNDFQTVHKGELLVQLDDSIYAAQLAQAEANVLGAQAAIANLLAQEKLQQANINSAEAALAGAQATDWRNALEATRQQKLLATGITGTEQQVEQADAAHRVSQADLAKAQDALDAARLQLRVQQTQEAQLEAALKAAAAVRNLAQINVGYTRITSPVDGMVSQRRVYPGEYVGVGTQVIAVVPLKTIYVIANYKETQLTRVRIGQPADVRVDTFPGVVLHGHVQSWSPGTGSQFALLPPDNATGNFTKVVQRIPVKITFDDDGGLGTLLRPGMSVETTIHTGDTPAPQ
jgi:membrane fusion protein (multidrug efflux system)